jgi:hypothetical protein
MTSIGAVDQLVSLLRTQLAAGAARAGVRTPSNRQKAGASARGTREPSLSGLIEARVKAIDRDDPQRGRKAFHVFLEAVLLSQFGEALINDPGFYQMVDDVQTALESAPATAPMVKQAIDELLRQST